jgi:hypothetical protein
MILWIKECRPSKDEENKEPVADDRPP